MSWQHTGKWPRYLLGPSDKPVPEHDIDATYNSQGEWVCHRCGWLVKLVLA